MLKIPPSLVSNEIIQSFTYYTIDTSSFNLHLYPESTLEKTEGAIKNGQ